jgi:serine/threonine-protein kinase
MSSKDLQYASSFAPDGKRLAFTSGLAHGDLWTVPVEIDSAGIRAGKPEPFLTTSFDERHPAFSPDGRWIAYDSNETGAQQFFVKAYPDTGGKWQISTDGGRLPMWSRNGRELFFRNNENQIMVAAYTARADSFLPEKPRQWSETKLFDVFNNNHNFDLAPDGKHIVALISASAPDERAQTHVIFLEKFFDELQRRIPGTSK